MKAKIWDMVVITFAIFLVAVAVHFFLIPSQAAIASITGLAMVLSNFIPLPVSALTLFMNIILLILGFLFIGREFGAKTVYCAILLPICLGILEQAAPDFQSFTNDQTLDALAYCIVVSVPLSMLFTRNASSGGLDIVAMFMNKYLRMELGKAMSIAGMVAAATSIFAYDTKTVVLSLLGTFFNGIVLDHFIFGSTIKKRVCIISEKYEEILDFILHELHSGATKYHAYGTFSDTCRIEINTIVDRNEYQKLMNYLTKTDPDAFVTIYAVNEMMYKPKKLK